MKKLSLIMICVLGYAVSPVFAQEETAMDASAPAAEENVFPTDVAPTVLSPEQEAEAEQLLKDARGIYSAILDDSKEGQADYLQVNMGYLEERIAKSKKELEAKQAELDKLNELVLDRRKSIDKSRADEATKAAQRVQLVEEFRNRQETLEFRINMLKRHIESLERRKTNIDVQLANLGTAVTPQVSDAQEAEKELERIKEKERDRRHDKYR